MAGKDLSYKKASANTLSRTVRGGGNTNNGAYTIFVGAVWRGRSSTQRASPLRLFGGR